MTVTGALPAQSPIVSPEARPYWEGARDGRLCLQRCVACAAVVWYPRGVCPGCGETRLEWFQATGRGAVYSFSVVRRGSPFGAIAPYVLAYVELEEGPRVLSNLVNCDPESVTVGSAVRAVFDGGLVRFEPA
jgi:uncharacterized protein